jgi:hypothetical protein
MWKYSGKIVREGRAWIGEGGIHNSPQWNLWTVAEKEAAGLKEFIPDSPPDSRLYTWSQNADGTIDSVAKPLDDVNRVDSDGVQVLNLKGKPWIDLGVKSTLRLQVKEEQGRLLSETDWAVVRRADVGTEVPENIKTWRDAIRVEATEMEEAIDAATDTAALAALFAAGTSTNWPELEA